MASDTRGGRAVACRSVPGLLDRGVASRSPSDLRWSINTPRQPAPTGADRWGGLAGRGTRSTSSLTFTQLVMLGVSVFRCLTSR